MKTKKKFSILRLTKNLWKKLTIEKNCLKKLIISRKNKVVGVGASAKGNTFINFLGLTNKEIFAVTDISSLK